MSATEQRVDVLIRWAGGFESRYALRRPVRAYEQLDDFERLRARLGELRRAGWRSPRIAAQLNAKASRRRNNVGHSQPTWSAGCFGVWRQARRDEVEPTCNHRSGRRTRWRGG